MAVARESAQIGLRHGERQEGRPRRDGNVVAPSAQRGDMLPGARRHGFDGSRKRLRRRAVEQRGGGHTGFGQQRPRHAEPTLSGVKRNGAQDSGKALTEPRLARETDSLVVIQAKRLTDEFEQGNGGPGEVILQGVKVLERLFAEIVRASVEDRVEARTLQAAGFDRLGQRGNDRVFADGTVIDPVDGVAPPLQPDLTEQRFRNDFGGLGGLKVECEEREQRVALPGRGEQRGQIAFAVEAAHFRRAVGTGIGQHFRITEPAYIAAMRPTTPLDTQRFGAWPDIFSDVPALEDARAVADDTARSVEERRDSLDRLAAASEDRVLKRSYEAYRKAVHTRRFRNWSDLVSYAGFAVAPVAEKFGEASGLDTPARQRLEAYCIAAHLLDLLLDCRSEVAAHDRVYLPGDWIRLEGVADGDLSASKTGPGLRAVLDRMLDRMDRIFSDAFIAARTISEADLRRAATIEIAERRRLARRLRRADPLAGRVDLTALDRVAVWFQTRLPPRGQR